MSNKVLLKKSSVAAKVPLTTDLDYGELALNYADGKIYFKNSSNVIKSFTIDDSVVTLTGTQTLTNKTLTSPTINGGALSGTFSGAATLSGAITLSNATASSSTSTGALIVAGGVGVGGTIYTDQIRALNNGNGTNVYIGDDTILGDINISNTLSIRGQQDATKGYIVFGSSNNTNYIGRDGTNPITVYGGQFSVNGNNTAGTAMVQLNGYSNKGGTGYHDFLSVTSTYGTATNPNKYFRLTSTGSLEILNSAYTATILSLTDAGALQVPAISVAGSTGTNGQVLASTGSGLQWLTVGGTGTVTSVGLSLPSIFTVTGSPVTSSGTLTATLASQTANTFLAAPNGTAGAPTMRAIVAADIPTLNQNTTGSAATVTGASQTAITSAANLATVGTITSGTWNAGAVTSSGGVQGTTLTSTIATGTAPLTVTSTTKVANLNVEQVDGYHADTANTASTIVVRDASKNIAVSGVGLAGSTSGTTTVVATAVAGTTTLTLPAATDTLVGRATTDTLTNKTLTFPIVDNIKMGMTQTATAAGTTTLTATSNKQQRFTGATTQTVVLPVTSTLTAGVSYEIENASTGAITVNSSGGNLVATVPAGVTMNITCVGTTLTTAADWDAEYYAFGSATGSGSVVMATSPTLVTPVLGTPSSGNLANCTFPTLNQNTTGSAAKWTTARTESLTGDITGSASVDGSANWSIATTLATVNANVGTFGSSSAIPIVTVNAKGLVTAVSTASISQTKNLIVGARAGAYTMSLTGASSFNVYNRAGSATSIPLSL